MADNKNSCFLEAAVSFLIGTATGFVLGVLFAPASGAETRKKIQEGAVKTGEKKPYPSSNRKPPKGSTP